MAKELYYKFRHRHKIHSDFRPADFNVTRVLKIHCYDFGFHIVTILSEIFVKF
jgi:hypothetical protein